MAAKHIRISVVTLAFFTVVTGVMYPLLVTAVAQIAFPDRANGSLIVRNGQPVGSTLIGQPFTAPGYFWSRPSATTPFPYNASASSGSNFSPLNPELEARIRADVQRLRASDPAMHAPLPADLVTSSASGLDPHISPDAARLQVPRVARARGLSAAIISCLVDRYTEDPAIGFFGEPRVNVLRVNLELDALQQKKGRQ